MKRILCAVLSVLMIVCSIAGAFNVSAASENLLADISTDDFGTNDTNKCPITGFEQYTDGTYGKAFNVKCAWYTSFYIKLPELQPNTEYQLGFK